MSLTVRQQRDTKKELKENFEKSGLTIKQVARDLDTSEEYIEQLFQLHHQS